MRTELVYFDSEYQSRKGFLRGLAALCFLIIFSFLWYEMIQKPIPSGKKAWVAMTIIFVLIASAIGVQLPKDVKTAMVYGALLGLVVYGVSNGMLLLTQCSQSVPWAMAEIGRGVVSTTLTSFLVYKIFF
jgi:hypothetical protein